MDTNFKMEYRQETDQFVALKFTERL